MCAFPVLRHRFILLLLLGSVVVVLGKRVKCPDGHSFCPAETTCCQLAEGQYGCCPLPNAVCCSDHLHCCPEDTHCDLQQQTCLQSNGIPRPLYRKFPASIGEQVNEDGRAPAEKNGGGEVICPDKTSKCPEHTTCCPLTITIGRQRRGSQFWRVEERQSHNPMYGCCPAEDAVCCADHEHCCPHGTQCDPKGGRCIRQAKDSSSFAEEKEKVTPMRKVPATQLTTLFKETEPTVRQCGDLSVAKGTHPRVSVCPHNEKCCRYRDEVSRAKLTGCCPFPDGHCCSHTAHCCPSGFACSREHGRCVNEQNEAVTLSTQLFPTSPAAKRDLPKNGQRPIPCLDGTFCSWAAPFSCCPRTVPDLNGITVYDCCPFDKGTCYARGGCCPQGHKCLADGGHCERMGVRERLIQLLLGN